MGAKIKDSMNGCHHVKCITMPRVHNVLRVSDTHISSTCCIFPVWCHANNLHDWRDSQHVAFAGWGVFTVKCDNEIHFTCVTSNREDAVSIVYMDDDTLSMLCTLAMPIPFNAQCILMKVTRNTKMKAEHFPQYTAVFFSDNDIQVNWYQIFALYNVLHSYWEGL